MLKLFLHYLMFVFPMFAAAASAVGAGGGADAGAGAGEGGDAGAGDGSSASDDLGVGDDGGAAEGDDLDAGAAGDGLEDEHQTEQQRQQSELDKETADLKGLVSKRLIALKKEAPEIAAVFQKYPKVQEQIEASFRRDMAYRELYPTVAEARQMREQFPNGMADVEQLMTEVGEIEQLDKSFYNRDAQGNYAGHTQLIQGWFQDDPAAMKAMFRTVPKEWARLDPQSYNDVMGSIVGATLQQSQIPDWLTECVASCDDPKNLPQLKKELSKMLQWSQGFQKRKAEPSEEERRLQSQRADFDRSTQQRKQEDQQRFHQNFVAESSKLQDSIVRKHPAIAALLATKNVTDAKKAEVIGKIRTAIQSHLKSSNSFMKKLRPLHAAGNLKETLDLQRSAWSYPWVLNKFVRQVMATETPNLVRQSPGARRQATSATQRQPVTRGTQQQQRSNERTAPYKEDGVWKKKDGSRFTTAEILRGLHLQA